MHTTVLVIDNHPIYRAGLSVLLKAQAGISVVGEAEDGQAALDQVARLHPDVVVIGIAMDDRDNIEATSRIISEFPATKVLALSVENDARLIEEMLHTGAAGLCTQGKRAGRIGGRH